MKWVRSTDRTVMDWILQTAICFGFVLSVHTAPAYAGAFYLSDQFVVPDVTLIVHPKGYDGTSGVVQVSVCVNPGTPHAVAVEAPMARAVATWNSLQPVIGGFVPPGTSTEVPPEVHDFESVLLHELGHGLVGLGHTNVRTKLPSEIAHIYRYATNSTWGLNGDWDFIFIGLDNRWGSGDDDRGDDINVHWYRSDLNDPFLLPIPPTVDSTTYKLSLADLPGTDRYAANANWRLSTYLGYADTEAVMFSTGFPWSESRALTADEVSTVRYAMSGLNELAGDSDDYSVSFVTTTDLESCDLEITFTANQESVPEDSLAVTTASFAGPLGQTTNHIVITDVKTAFNDSNVRWFFSDGPNLRIMKTDSNRYFLPGATLVYTIGVLNNGNTALSGVSLTDVVPADTTFEPAQSHALWDCDGTAPGSNCTFPVGSLAAGGSLSVNFAVTVVDPLSPGVSRISNTVAGSDDGANGPDIDPSDNSATDTNVLRVIFEDDFESGDTSAWSATVP